MAKINLNIRLIREGTSKEFVSYLDELRQNQSDISICRALFKAVDHEYLTPAIFAVFLSWSKSFQTIALCIHHASSRLIRKQGIKHFGKTLADPEKWESAWKVLGGTDGLVSLLAELSVTEGKTFVRMIGRCNRGQRKVPAREKAIEELLHALLPSHYPGSKFQSHDKRPIQDHYAQMVSACSPEFVDQLLDAKDKSNPLYRHVPARRLIWTHGELLKKRIVKSIFGDGDKEDRLHQYLKAFVYTQPPRPGQNPKVSASMEFAMKVLQTRLENIDKDIRWPTGVSEADMHISVLERSIKRKLLEEKILDIFMMGLKIVEAKPALKGSFASKGIWSKLNSHYKRTPRLYEDCYTFALRLELSGTHQTIGRDFLQISRDTKTGPEGKWKLLRLYCFHVPKIGIDIDTSDDFKPLANQQWSSEIFEQLSKDNAVRLLTGLYNANQKYSFLGAPSGTSILSGSNQNMSQQNFNAVLLLTMLQRDSKNIQRKAENSVDELRKKSAIAREQSDRAQLAKAASASAIASGRLDLYGDTITWQQRFVRDPLTLKVVFGRDAVMTKEGIELLSGIPKLLPEDMTLAQIGLRVEKANEILMTFHETIIIAKREPSFYEPDWAGVTSLFGAVIDQRVTRTGTLQKRLQDSHQDIYAAIWAGTLVMLEKVNVDFLRQAYPPIRTLLYKLPPATLASITKTMLETGNERREKHDRQPADDILERLSYELLLHLADGDKPELAQQLVLRTIVDRPDASSWHRQLLSVKFMKRLSAEDAHQMLLAFATAIGEKLEEQSYVKVGETQPSPSKPPQSLVKVTTVKYLAQLLDNAEFLSAEAAVEVLVELFKAGTHRDIRLATLDSLLSLLNNLCSGVDENWRSNPLVEKIMEALETVIPVVGSINERRPPRLEDWEEAGETGILPEVSDISAGLPPLLSAIFRAPASPQYPGLKNMRAEFVARFLLPILGHSQDEHRTWVKLFLEKHNANFTVDDLPPMPISPQMLKTLVEKYRDLIPQTVLEDFNKHIVLTIAPPAALQIFQNSLEKDSDINDTPEVQHWFSVYHLAVDHYSASGTQILLRMIQRGSPLSSIPNGIECSSVLDMVLTHASLFLDNYEKYTDIWTNFIEDLRPPTSKTYPQGDAASTRAKVSTWQKYSRPVLEKAIELVHEKKDKYARKHNLSLLPSTIKLRLWLLPYPCFLDPSELDFQLGNFARALKELLDNFLQNETNVLRWPKIAQDACSVSTFLNTSEERLRVAIHIGRIGIWEDNSGDERENAMEYERDHQRASALNFISVMLAIQLIEDGRGALKKDSKGKLLEEGMVFVQGFRKRIEGGQRADDENIREKVVEWRKGNGELWKTLMIEE